MPQLLTTNAQIFCPHTGKGTTVPTSPKWQIDGGFVCAEGDAGTLACPFLPLPCVGYVLKSMGLNATTIDGRKAILVTDFNQTLTGLPLVMTESHPVNDQSTPAPIPAGSQAAPLAPELTDLVKPIVVAAPPSFPFKITPPPTPTPVVITFTLTAQHPLEWVLTLINETLGQHTDLTNGIPGGVTVAPSGGDWSTSVLTVVVTMTPAFAAALTPGKNDLYMTGVSKRGLSGHTSATIMVSP